MMDFDVRRAPPPAINLSALIDIAFILVIFIVLGATFQRKEAVEVNLPGTEGPAELDAEALVVTVPIDGPVRVGDDAVADEDLPAALQRARGQYESIILLADRQAPVERAVEVLATAQGQGFSSVSFATDPRAATMDEPGAEQG